MVKKDQNVNSCVFLNVFKGHSSQLWTVWHKFLLSKKCPIWALFFTSDHLHCPLRNNKISLSTTQLCGVTGTWRKVVHLYNLIPFISKFSPIQSFVVVSTISTGSDKDILYYVLEIRCPPINSSACCKLVSIIYRERLRTESE